MVVHPELVAAIRASRALLVLPLLRPLLRNPLYLAHLRFVGDEHLLGFLARRHYLSSHLSVRARTEAAAHHYRDQLVTMPAASINRVYRADGLLLWERTVDDVRYEIRLQPGNDVLLEGGLSVVLFVDGGRVAVVSFSSVDGEDFGLPAGPQIFVGRKQLTHEHDYQKAFNKAFDRTSPAHLCLAALEGIATARGLSTVAAVTADHHPNFKEAFADPMRRAYDESWEELGGRRVGAVFHLPIPFELPSLEDLPAAKRKRARARRAHLAEVTTSTAARLAAAG